MWQMGPGPLTKVSHSSRNSRTSEVELQIAAVELGLIQNRHANEPSNVTGIDGITVQVATVLSSGFGSFICTKQYFRHKRHILTSC
jgi:hypothetical protein